MFLTLLIGSIFPSPGWAEEDLLEILLENKTITREQYEELKGKRIKQKKLRKGFGFETSSGDFKFGVGGRLHLDAAWYGDDFRDLGNGTKVRRSRIFVKGILFKDWVFKGQYDFANNGVSVKDAYIAYHGFDSSAITLGHFKESFSLENMTSSRFITFMEEALPNAFAPGRNLGIQYMTHGDNWTFAMGAFGEDVGDERNDDEGYGFSSRITYAPWYEKKRALHFGMAGAFREPDEESGAKGFDSRPESNITPVKLLDTGDITGTLHYTTLGLETALVRGPLSLQGELMWVRVNRETLANPDFYGGYAYASWFLTGESRKYSPINGKFGRVYPRKNLGEGGIGAWELAVRYSFLDLNDGDIRGGEMSNITVGLNWYANPRIRFMANFIQVNTDPNVGNDDPQVYQLRAQVDF